MREGDFQLKYRLWELESLYDIGLSIAGTLNIDELADEILFRMISLINARRAALFLREGDEFRSTAPSATSAPIFSMTSSTEHASSPAGKPLDVRRAARDCIFPDCIASSPFRSKATTR